MSKINKNDLIKQISKNTNISNTIVKQVINNLCETVEDNILKGNEVSIKGLVRFYNREHKEKEVQDFETRTRKKIGKRVLPDAKISRAIIDKYKHD